LMEDTFPVGAAEPLVSNFELLELPVVEDGEEDTVGVLAAGAPVPDELDEEDSDPLASSGVSVLVSGAKVG